MIYARLQVLRSLNSAPNLCFTDNNHVQAETRHPLVFPVHICFAFISNPPSVRIIIPIFVDLLTVDLYISSAHLSASSHIFVDSYSPFPAAARRSIHDVSFVSLLYTLLPFTVLVRLIPLLHP